LLRIDAAKRMAAALASAHRDQLLSLEQHDSATRTQESEQPTPRSARDLPYDSSGTTGAGASGHKRDVALAESAGAAAPSGAQQRPEPFPPKSARAPVLPMQPHPPVSSACCVLRVRCTLRVSLPREQRVFLLLVAQRAISVAVACVAASCCAATSVCRCFLLRSNTLKQRVSLLPVALFARSWSSCLSSVCRCCLLRSALKLCTH
jgi:hypothetical protein